MHVAAAERVLFGWQDALRSSLACSVLCHARESGRERESEPMEAPGKSLPGFGLLACFPLFYGPT